MPFGIKLTGTRLNKKKGNDNWLLELKDDILGKIFPAYELQDGDSKTGDNFLLISLHPCAEPIKITAYDKDSVSAYAITGNMGPGYHIAVCELLKKISTIAGISWDPPSIDEGTGDPTSYLFMSNIKNLEEKHLEWLKDHCDNYMDLYGDSESVARKFVQKKVPIQRPNKLDYFFRQGDYLPSSLGPYSLEWTHRISDDPAMGKEYFPWWRNSRYSFVLSSIAHRLWYDFAWRKPVTEDEAHQIWLIVRDLELCYQMDRTLDFFWSEWHELNTYLKDYDLPISLSELVESKAKETEPLNRHRIGFRRNQMRIGCDGWTVEIPGAFEESLDREEKIIEARSTSGAERIVRMSVPWKFLPKRDGTNISSFELVRNLVRPAPMDHQILQHAGPEGLVAKAWWEEAVTADKTHLWLKSITAITGEAVLTSIFIEDSNDRDWALETWRSIAPNSLMSGGEAGIIELTSKPVVSIPFVPAEHGVEPAQLLI